MAKDIIRIVHPDNDVSRTNHVSLPFSMTYAYSDGHHVTFLPVYPGNAEYVHMPAGNTPMHQHDYFELFYILNGEVYQTIEAGTFRYKKGDACLMNRNIRHCESSSTLFSGVFLNLLPDYIDELLTKDVVLDRNLKAKPADGPIRRFLFSNLRGEEQFKRSYLHFSGTLHLDASPEPQCLAEHLLDKMAEELLAQKNGASYMISGLVARFIGTLENPRQYHVTHMELDSNNEDFIYAKIVNYLTEKKGNLSRPELAAALNYHAEYLNQIVKKKTGLSLMQLGKTYRLAEARRLLTETGKSISDIVQDLGYVSRSHFYRFFKDGTGLLPLEYRQQAIHITNPDAGPDPAD